MLRQGGRGLARADRCRGQGSRGRVRWLGSDSRQGSGRRCCSTSWRSSSNAGSVAASHHPGRRMIVNPLLALLVGIGLVFTVLYCAPRRARTAATGPRIHRSRRSHELLRHARHRLVRDHDRVHQAAQAGAGQLHPGDAQRGPCIADRRTGTDLHQARPGRPGAARRVHHLGRRRIAGRRADRAAHASPRRAGICRRRAR